MTGNHSQTAVRKTAILVATLDTRAADALLDKMPEAFAEQVRQMVFELGDVAADEQEEVIREFMLAGGLDPAPQSDASEENGVELQLSSDVHRDLPDSRPFAHPQVRQHFDEPPFAFLQNARGDVLARHLAPQHPQVIAVVAAHIPPSQAADLIKRLAPPLQADVLRRVAELDPANEEILRDVETELRALLSDELRAAKNRQTGIANVMTILESAGADRGRLLISLSKHQRELAEQLRHPVGHVHTNSREEHPVGGYHAMHRSPQTRSSRPFKESARRDATAMMQSAARTRSVPAATSAMDHEPPAQDPPSAMRNSLSVTSWEFEELANLPDDGWAAIIRAAEPDLILLALTGASEQLLKRITHRLSKQEAQALRSRLQVTGPVRISDIEEAQRQVARLASRLAAAGELQLPQPRGFAAAA